MERYQPESFDRPTENEKKADLLSEIRRRQDDSSKSELIRAMPEALKQQLGSAYAAYRAVADRLLYADTGAQAKYEAAISFEELEQLLAAKNRQWQENGTHNYLVEQLLENGTRFSLVATPNIEASEDQIVALVESFGRRQPGPANVHDELYRRSRYNGQQWSGNTGDSSVRLSLIPSRLDEELSDKTVGEQRRLLSERQARHPELNARVPSLLEAVTYWHVLRAQGDKLADSSASDKTAIRHFDLEPETDGGQMVVPCSLVSPDGRPSLFRSYAEFGDVARLAIG